MPQLCVGEKVSATVTLSHEEIDSPVVREPEAAIVMSAALFKQLEKRVKPGGMLFLDSSVVKDRATRDDLRVFYVPATKAAAELGDSRVANLIFLGAYLEATKTLPLEAIEVVLEKRLAGAREALLLLNKKALREGARLLSSYEGEPPKASPTD